MEPQAITDSERVERVLARLHDLKRPGLSNQAGKRHNYRRGNPQRRVLLEQLARGKSVTEAGKIAGYSCPQAASNALRAMRGQIADALVKNGWGPEEFVTKHLIPLLEARKTLYFAHQGIVTDKRIVKDMQVRLAAGDQYSKILGLYAPITVEHTGVVEHVLTAKEKQEAIECLRRIEAFASEEENPLLAELADDGTDPQ